MASGSICRKVYVLAALGPQPKFLVSYSPSCMLCTAAPFGVVQALQAPSGPIHRTSAAWSKCDERWLRLQSSVAPQLSTSHLCASAAVHQRTTAARRRCGENATPLRSRCAAFLRRSRLQYQQRSAPLPLPRYHCSRSGRSRSHQTQWRHSPGICSGAA